MGIAEKIQGPVQLDCLGVRYFIDINYFYDESVEQGNRLP